MVTHACPGVIGAVICGAGPGHGAPRTVMPNGEQSSSVPGFEEDPCCL